MNYSKSYTLNERRSEALRVKQKYPDRLPIICNKHHSCNKLNNIDRIKFLVPNDLTIGQFMFIIRRRLKLQQDVAIYFIINGFIPKTSELIKTLYEDNMNEDYFLYIHYTSENVFG
jgi:GABA(A) receptor-associated protein